MFSLNIGACCQDLVGQGKVCGSGICCRNRNSISYLKGIEGYFRALKVDETVGRAGGVALGFASPSSSCVWWGSICLHPREGDGGQEPPQQHCCHAGTTPAHHHAAANPHISSTLWPEESACLPSASRIRAQESAHFQPLREGLGGSSWEQQ